MNIQERFTDKIAIITGSADGIGKGVASRLGKEGATLALMDINEDLLQKTVGEFKASGIKAKGYLVNVSNPTQVSEAIARVEKDWGRIDILVHAAGIVGPTSTKITAKSNQERADA
ncbi:MAG: SDR family NAD(P)-dependent oxidoreductase [Flavitalea sp.]